MRPALESSTCRHVADAEQQRGQEGPVMLDVPPTVTTIRK
jgi:hypothetical protein